MSEPTVVSRPAARVDALDKVRGAARYVDDLELPGMLHCKVVTSAHPHAEVHSVDVSLALASAGVFAVLTARDVPGENQIGVVTADQPLLVERRARMLADRIALVAADTPEHALEAARKVKVEYRPLPVIADTDQALAAGAARIHDSGNLLAKKQVVRGDLGAGWAAAKLVLERTFTTGYQEHAYLETNGVLAVPEQNGALTVYASAQCPFYIQKAVARVLGKDLASIRCVQATTGGAFGGKEDYPSEPAACAALLAMKTGRPVKLVYQRSEDIRWSSKRHPIRTQHRIGFDGEGRITACEVKLHCDAGAYNGLSTVVSERANASAPGPYRAENVRVDTYVVYTNNLFGGAFRGFGAPQVTFAMEAQLDEAAERLGLSPAEIRRRNLLRVGDATATGQRLPESVGALECLEKAVERSRFEEKRALLAEHNRKSPHLKKGIGLACCMYGCCLHAGGQFLEGSGSLVQVRPDGSVNVAIGGTELGQGAFTVVAQLAAEELGCELSKVHVSPVSTELVPDSGPTVASRTTVMSGNAVLDAARQIKSRMLEVAAQKLDAPQGRLEARGGDFLLAGGLRRLSFCEVAKACYERKVNLTAEGWFAPPRKEWNEALGLGEAYSVYCFATQVAEVTVDLRSGRVTVDRVTAAHDVGKAINPAALKGQVEGGVVQGLGYALMEELQLSEGKCLNPNFTDYLIPSSADAPEVEVVLVEHPWSLGPFGAKGVGEPALIPVAAAVANAVSFALGHRFDRLPLTPERVLLTLEDSRGTT
ncbi:MAG: xanthine dehydrogenase family protein [Myxococcales bacterium]|nr:xanthine dehydrogenase family protein [Myxococcales bacterium]